MRHILVCYATETGTTHEFAEIIADTLRALHHTVDVFPADDAPDASLYDAVILGSAIQGGNWLPAALAYAEAQRAALNSRPVAVFNVHIANTGSDHKSRTARAAYFDGIRAILNPVDAVNFTGRFSRKGAATLLPRWLARLVPTVDLRRPKKVQAWAAALSDKLTPVPA